MVILLLGLTHCGRVGFDPPADTWNASSDTPSGDTVGAKDTSTDVPSLTCDESECAQGDDPCTIALCKNGVCASYALPNGRDCTIPEQCIFGSCVEGACQDDPTADRCQGNEPCIAATCVRGQGCVYKPVDCDDGESCTLDVCNTEDGTCKHVWDDECTCIKDTDCPAVDDARCTEYKCKQGACIIKFRSGSCVDEDPCTMDDKCIEGICQGEPKCGKDDPCDEEICWQGECLPNDLPCDDGDACTTDSCGETGCEHTPIETDTCDDDDLCTTDTCHPELGCASEDIDPTTCDDGIDCTLDTCVFYLGCVHAPGEGCACQGDTDCLPDAGGELGADACSEIACVGGQCSIDIESDGTPCQGDCGIEGKCESGNCAIGGSPCDDNNLCTEDLCVGDECVNFSTCDDGIPCTEDYCDSQGACLHEEIACEDDEPCTLSFCLDGGCIHLNSYCSYCLKDQDCETPCAKMICKTKGNNKVGECEVTEYLIDCLDGNYCTLDACHAITGECSHQAQPGKPCDEGFCNWKGQCD